MIISLATAAMTTALLGCSSADTTEHGDGHVATVSGGAAEGPYAGREISDPKPRPEIALTDQDGSPFNFVEETAGQPTLLFFGFANCPDVCPTTMADVALALKSVPADVAARTQVVFVTTDPARDTAEFLGTYLAQFDQGLPNRFIGLTGTQSEVEMAQTLAGVPLAESGGEMHSTTLFLYGPDDVARVMFSAGDSQAEIAKDLETIATA